MNRLNHKHCHVFYFKQLYCVEILTAIFNLDKQIRGIMTSNGSMHTHDSNHKHGPQFTGNHYHKSGFKKSSVLLFIFSELES